MNVTGHIVKRTLRHRSKVLPFYPIAQNLAADHTAIPRQLLRIPDTQAMVPKSPVHPCDRKGV
jgi:hypothetical protein